MERDEMIVVTQNGYFDNVSSCISYRKNIFAFGDGFMTYNKNPRFDVDSSSKNFLLLQPTQLAKINQCEKNSKKKQIRENEIYKMKKHNWRMMMARHRDEMRWVSQSMRVRKFVHTTMIIENFLAYCVCCASYTIYIVHLMHDRTWKRIDRSAREPIKYTRSTIHCKSFTVCSSRLLTNIFQLLLNLCDIANVIKKNRAETSD